VHRASARRLDVSLEYDLAAVCVCFEFRAPLQGVEDLLLDVARRNLRPHLDEVRHAHDPGKLPNGGEGENTSSNLRFIDLSQNEPIKVSDAQRGSSEGAMIFADVATSEGINEGD
jgi:hypothetical protein